MQTITFQIDTDAAPCCTAKARLNGAKAEILSVRDAAGQEVHVTHEDLDRMEAVIFDETSAVEINDGFTRSRYEVSHYGDTINRIRDAWGFLVPRASALFTEVAEAFHIDRRWKAMEDGDVQGYARRCYC